MARTITDIRTPEMRRRARQHAEKQQRVILYRMLATAVLLRHACGIAAAAGSSGWWLTALCTLPGLGMYALMRFALRRAGVQSVPELARKCLGQSALRWVNAVPAAALTIEGAASVTSLTALFTDSLITTVDAWLFALAAAAVLCLCTGRDGLLHGASLLRWVLGALAAAVFGNMLLKAKPNHLFPVGGDGPASWMSMIGAWWGMAWPVVLMLWEEPAEGRSRRPLLPAVMAVSAVFALCLALPHEVLSDSAQSLPRTLAERMLLPGTALQPAIRMLLMCLWTAGLALTALIASVRAADLLLPSPPVARWLPCALLLLFAALQQLDGDWLHSMVFTADRWLLAPFAVVAAALLIISLRRRKGQ